MGHITFAPASIKAATTLATATFVAALGLAATAQARTVESVAVTPSVQVGATPAATQGLPGSAIPLAINVINSGAHVDLTGEIGYSGQLFTNSVVKSWYAVLEYRPPGGPWTPLAGIERKAPGYTPSSGAPLTTGLTATVVQVPRFGVTYPASGDRIVGTQVASINSAQWGLALSAARTPAEIAQLLSSSQTSEVRIRTRIEAQRTGLFGIQYIDAQTRTATFVQMLRSQSAAATDVRVTVTGSGSAQQFTQTNTPGLSSMAPGGSVTLAGSISLPGLQTRQPGESDGDYLNRLRAAVEQSVNVTTSASHKAGGVATPYWWWPGEWDPGYDLGPLRTIELLSSVDAVGVAAPVMEIGKSGPATIDAGQTAEYEIGVHNTGDASGTATATDTIDGQASAAISGIGALAPGEARQGTHSYAIPANFQSTQLHDQAAVTWTDGVNQYGPLTADFTSTVVLDTTPPAPPQLTSAPPPLTNVTGAGFEFTGESGGVFVCTIDSGEPANCLSPFDLDGLADGQHSFGVWQIDDAGNVGSATSFVWTVDTVAPDAPQLSGVPSSPTAQTEAAISFAGEPGGSFECEFDFSQWEPCDSPRVFDSLAEGQHKLRVRQTDAAGNVGAAAQAEWTVDTVAPGEPQLSSTPGAMTQNTTAGFGFAGEPGGSFACRLDDEPFAPCSNPASYENLGEGAHQFVVRQTDEAGNVGDPAEFSWIIDLTAPAAPGILSAPPSLTNQASASFEFAGEPGGTLSCALDGGEFAFCASPANYNGLEDGSHTFSVRQTDDAGNVGSVTTHMWIVDATPPDSPTIESGPTGLINSDTAIFEFSGEVGATFECRFDVDEFEACSSPRVYADLAAGEHTFTVRQIDEAGNRSPATLASFTVQLSGTNVGIEDETLTVTSDPGSVNTVSVSFSGGIYTIIDQTSTISPAAGCQSEDIHTVTCNEIIAAIVEPGLYAAAGDTYLLAVEGDEGDSQIADIEIGTSDLDDSITVESSVTVPATLDGGDGNDELSGGPQGDAIFGGEGDDQIDSVDSEIDQVSCGEGADSADADTVDVLEDCEQVSHPTTVARIEPFLELPGVYAIEYRAAPGEDNDIAVSTDGATIAFNDSTSAVVAGPGCEQVTSGSVSCDLTNITVVYAFLKDGNDTFAADPTYDALTTGVYGGEGDDVLQGGPGTDGFDGGPGADAISGGAGFDSALYTYRDIDRDDLTPRDEGVAVSLDDEAGDGSQGEGDNIASDIEWVIGSNEDDTLAASDNDTVLSGLSGDDSLTGGLGDDRLHGNQGDDALDGGPGADYIDGYEGFDTIDYSSRTETVYVGWYPDHPADGEEGENDDLRGVERVVGGGGDDFLGGSILTDTIEGGPGSDTIDAREGDDLIKVRDGELDHVTCGDDADTAEADALDELNTDCETIDLPPTHVTRDGDAIAVDLDEDIQNTLSATRAHGKYVLTNTGAPLTAGAGCSQRGSAEVACDVSGVQSMSVSAGNLGDEIVFANRVAVPVSITGGAGDDRLTGGSGADLLIGGGGNDDLDGAAGADSLDAGGGDDEVASVDGEVDSVACGDDVDSSRSDRLDSVQDCESAETVSVAAFVTFDFGFPVPLFVYYAASGQQNDVVAATTTRTATFTDSGADITAGTACSQVEQHEVRCLGSNALGALVNLGDENDTSLSRGSTAVIVGAYGEAGDDELRGGTGTDALDGGPGNDLLLGERGNDMLLGDEGDDRLDGGGGADTLNGGGGADTADYSSRTEAVTVSLGEGSGDNGELEERDVIEAGVEHLVGGAGDDELSGSEVANRLDGGSGEDTIDGLAGDDDIRVRDGSRDEVSCPEGVDSIVADTLDEVATECAQVDRANLLRIDDSPADGEVTNETEPIFEFRTDDVGAAFECNVDDAEFAPCASPYVAGPLSDGEHTVTIRVAGLGESVATSFTVDTLPPLASITAGPQEGETIGTTSPTFTFSSGEPNATFECGIRADDDEMSFRSCRSPYKAALGYGDYAFEVRAIDAAGNRSASVVRNFEVSPSAVAEFGVAPADGAHVSGPLAFSFTGVDAVGFECSAGGGEFASCSSPYPLDWPYVGAVTFAVRALDIFGNPGPVIKRTVIFDDGDPADDDVRPKTLLNAGPENDSSITYAPVFEFSSNEDAEFVCRLDDEDWTPCESPWTLSGLTSGEHHVEIAATDKSGNFTDAAIARDFTFEGGDEEIDLTLAPPLERANGLSPTINFDLGEVAAAQVNIDSGELSFMSDDITPSEDGTEQLVLTRYYNSQSEAVDTGLGSRWTLSAGPDIHIAIQAEASSVELHGPGGYVATFFRDEDDQSSFVGPETLAAALRETATGGYVLERSTGEDDVIFDADGTMVSTKNSLANVAAVANREVGGRTVLDSYGFEGGDTLTAMYSGADRLESLSHSAPLQPVGYQHNIAGSVQAVTSTEGASAYSYDENGYLSGISLPDGTTVAIELDSAGRTESLTLDRESEDPATTNFQYGPTETTVTKPDGTQSSYANATALDGAGSQNPSAHDEMSDAYAAANGVSPGEADDAIDTQVKTAELGDSLRRELGSDFAGLWYAPAEGGRVKVQVGPNGSIEQAQAVVDAFGATEVADVQQVEFAEDQLTEVASQIAVDLADLIDQRLVAIHQSAERNRVVVEIANTVDSQQRQLAQDAVGESQGAAEIVEVDASSFNLAPMRSRFRCVHGDGVEGSDKYHGCSRPLRGSVGIAAAGFNPYCSNAFVGRVGRVPATLTAGHCINDEPTGGQLPQKRKWAAQTRTRFEMETVGRNFSRYEFGDFHTARSGPTGPVGGDAAAISIRAKYWKKKPQPRIVYKKVSSQNPGLGPTDSDYLGIRGAANVYENQMVCIAGAHSGAHCGEVTDTQLRETYCEEIQGNVCIRDGATLDGMVDVDLRASGNCGIIPGDSGGPVIAADNRLAVGVISAGGDSGCRAVHQPLLDNRAGDADPLLAGAMSITGFCLTTVGSKTPVCSDSARTGSLAAKIRIGPPDATTNGQPSFFISPRGAETNYSFQVATDPAGENIVYEAPSRDGGSEFTELQVPGSEYAGCVLEPDGRYIRVFAQNANGARATSWVYLPKNCDVDMLDPPTTTLTGGRSSNAVGRAGVAVWIVDAATSRGAFDLPPGTRLQLRVGYENCDQNHDSVTRWVDDWGPVLPGEIFNCRYVPKCHPSYCGGELDPIYGMASDGAVDVYDLPPDVLLSDIVPAVSSTTLDIGNPDIGCSDGASHIRHIVTPVYAFKVLDTPYAGPGIVKRGNATVENYPSYICH